jgi:hypothetical protein
MSTADNLRMRAERIEALIDKDPASWTTEDHLSIVLVLGLVARQLREGARRADENSFTR